MENNSLINATISKHFQISFEDGKKKCILQVFHKSWEFNYFFSYISDRTIYLFCNFQPSVIKKYVLKKHCKTHLI